MGNAVLFYRFRKNPIYVVNLENQPTKLEAQKTFRRCSVGQAVSCTMQSLHQCSRNLPLSSRKESLVLEHYLPPFCIMDPILTPRVGELTKESWERVVSGEAQGFKRIKESNPTLTSLVYFYDRFYAQLFFLYPELKRFFQTSIMIQGGRLVKSLMGLATIGSFNTKLVQKRLVDLAEKHNQIGVHPMFYGGFVWNIIVTLRYCLGDDWSDDIEEAWIISGSYILRTMVPIAIKGTRHFSSPYVVPRVPSSQFDCVTSNDLCAIMNSTNNISDPLFGPCLPITSQLSLPPEEAQDMTDFCANVRCGV